MSGLLFRVLVSFSLPFIAETAARADGGKIQISQTQGAVKVTVSTNPTVARVGVLEVSVLTQDAKTGKTLLDVPVTVEAFPAGNKKESIGGPATSEASVNKLYKTINLKIPQPGRWVIDVRLQPNDGLIRLSIPLEVAEALPAWLSYLPWIGWPLALVLFFMLHHYLLRRRKLPGRIPGIK